MRGDRRARRGLIGGVTALLVGSLALAGCGVGRTEPQLTPAGGGNKILLVGDELLGRVAPKLAPTLAVNGVSAQVLDLTAPGTGLLDAGIVGAVSARLDANPDASMVVIGFSGHCAACAGGYAGPGQAAAWTAAAQQLVDVVRAHGKTPVWVTAPPVAPGLPIASSWAVIADAGTAVARANGLVIANLTDAFTDVDGRYQPTLSYARLFEAAAFHTVRTGDGIGFTDDGAARASTWIAAAIRSAWSVPLIVDTDMFLDVDDAGGLGVAFALQRLGEARILAVGVDLRADRTQVADTSWQCAAAFAAFYTDGGSVPLGVAPPREGVQADVVDYTAACAPLAPPGLPTPPPAVDVYRQALAAQPDGSVVIAGTGYEGNLAALLASAPDASSPLTGRQLVARKVRTLVVMASGFPSSTGEHNVQGDIVSAQAIASSWPTKVVWAGSEVGFPVVTGATISAAHPLTSPLRVSYEAYRGPSTAWFSWDLTAVYHAVRPADAAMVEIGPGTNHIDDTGANTFTPGPGNQYYLRLDDGTSLSNRLEQLLDVTP